MYTAWVEPPISAEDKAPKHVVSSYNYLPKFGGSWPALGLSFPCFEHLYLSALFACNNHGAKVS